MKKFIYILIAVMTTFIFTACNTSSGSGQGETTL